MGCRIVTTNKGLQVTNTGYKQKRLQCHNAVFLFMISYSFTIYILVMYKRWSKNTPSLIYLYFCNPALFCNINTEQNVKPFLILKHWPVCWTVLIILDLSLSFIIFVITFFFFTFPFIYKNDLITITTSCVAGSHLKTNYRIQLLQYSV